MDASMASRGGKDRCLEEISTATKHHQTDHIVWAQRTVQWQPSYTFHRHATAETNLG